MHSYVEDTERIIGEIKKIDEKLDTTKLKDLVLELADHIAEGIDSNRPEIINKFKLILKEDTERPRGQDKIDKTLISLLIQKIANKHFKTISVQWIIMCLPKEYKNSRVFEKKEKIIHASEISDANLLTIADDVKRRLRQIENTSPAKEIKVKNDEEHIREMNWECHMADELSKLALKCENEHHKHDDKYCKDSAKIIRMARDKRFATTFSRYQAIVVSAEHSRSLANLAAGEVVVLSRWDAYDNEKHCTECIDLIHCRAEKCTHGCHDFKKEMTTKGIKWALRETQELKELETQMKRLATDSDDMCNMMKMIFINPALNMTQGDKKNIMAKHIKVDKCDQCIYFEMEHPQFFKEHLV